MKLKALTIAVLAAATGMTTATVQAEKHEASWYGSIRIGYQYLEDNKHGNGDDRESQFRNLSSRIGFQAETEVLPGLTGFGKYEFSVGGDSSGAGVSDPDNDSGLGTRQAYAGLKGDFGRILIGNTEHTFYNNVTAKYDIPWWVSGTGTSGNGTYIGRSGEALSYDKDFGQFGIGATAYLGDDQFGDGYELGANVDIANGHNVGVAIRDVEDRRNGDDDSFTYGIGVNGKFGTFQYGLGYTDRDKSGTAFDVHLEWNRIYVNFGEADRDDGRNPRGVTLGYTWRIGKKTSMWFEAASTDADIDGQDESNAFRAAFKYDL